MTGNPEATRPNAIGDIASMVNDGVPVAEPTRDGVAMKKETEMTLPDCMMPDGGEACVAFRDLLARAEAAEAAVAEARKVIAAMCRAPSLSASLSASYDARAWLFAHPEPTRPTT